MPEPRRSWRDRPLARLTLVRYLEFVREPEAMFWVFVFPMLLAAGLGIAFRSRPQDQIRVGVLQGPGSDSVSASLEQDPRLVVRRLDDSGSALALRTGKIALLVIPADSGVTYRFDETRPDARVARQMTDDILQRGAGRSDPVPVREEQVRERGSRYIDFLVPGLLGMNLMGTGIWGVGFAVVDQRRKKLLKRLISTPMRRGQYLLSFMLSRLVWLILEVVALVGFGLLAFGVPLRGSLGTLAVVCLLAAFAFSGLGLMIAARPKTIEAASGLMNLVMMPMWVFSGVFFNSANFPDAMQPFIQALPLTATVDALRATMLEGATLAALAPEFAVIGVWMVVSFGVALKIFRWQ
jgi:ABC-type multidrug transport system permease subunit